jgi:LemA protein
MDLIIPLVLLGGVVLLPLVWAVATFNRFTRLRQHKRESWSDIEVEMQRRYELIPNLVETVRGFVEHEREVLQEIVQLRNRASANHGSASSQAVDEQALAIGLDRLFVVAEAYPELKSSAHFLALQRELSLTEDRIAAARRFYNGNVRELNQLCETFPSMLIAGLSGFKRADFFDAAAAATVNPSVSV